MITIPIVLAIFFSTIVALRGVPMSLDFSSGTLVSYHNLDNRPDANGIEQALVTLYGAEVKADVTQDPSTSKFGLDIQTTKVLDENLENQTVGMLSQQFGIQGIPDITPFEPALSEAYMKQTVLAIVGALIAMGVILLIVFRRKVSLAMLPCVVLNMIAAFGGMALFQVQFSLASLAGFLLLVGYSIDTNILLGMSVMRRVGGEVRERVANAMKTGFMITGTTIATMAVVNLFVTNASIDQLSIVIVFGLIADLFNTWFLNAGILIRHAGRKKGKEHYVSL
jgi:preprotein translocase subunit SecF